MDRTGDDALGLKRLGRLLVELVRVSVIRHILVDGNGALDDVELTLHLGVGQVGQPGRVRVGVLNPDWPDEGVHDHQERLFWLLREADRIPVRTLFVASLDQQTPRKVTDDHHGHLTFGHRPDNVTPGLGAVEFVQVGY